MVTQNPLHTREGKLAFPQNNFKLATVVDKFLTQIKIPILHVCTFFLVTILYKYMRQTESPGLKSMLRYEDRHEHNRSKNMLCIKTGTKTQTFGQKFR